MADGEVPGDVSLKAKPGVRLEDLKVSGSAVVQGSDAVAPEDLATDLDDALPLPPTPRTGPILVAKPLMPNVREYIQFADGTKKPGDVLTDEECELLGLPKGSVVPELDGGSLSPSFRPKTTDGPPPFTLDEAEGEEEHEGHTRTFHAEEQPGTAEGLAAEAKALFDSLLQQGFEHNDALELVKEMVRMTYFPDHAAKK